MEEWQQIAVYQASQADAFKTVLEIAPKLNTATKKWLQLKYKDAKMRQQEAESYSTTA